ncbi:MAG: hypothetical protein LBI82_06450 [Dysgonamonadaceae bacterium]|jgi:cell division protein FtsI (penicillin-binding protein 3)|nr:hypothetical protein [Dysgonamonadaceae bacterium]
MKMKIYFLTFLVLLCVSCKDKKVSTVQAEQNVSTIDTTFQKIAENALNNQLEVLNADAGIAIVMDVETGTIKAVANKNLSENDTIETASLFKVPCMIVALDDSIVSPNDKIDTGDGILNYKGVTIKDITSDKGGYGKITAEQVIMFSSNVGTAKIILQGYENNPNKFIDGLHNLGFVDIPKDRPITDYLSLGSGIKIPAIEMLQFYNSIANGTVKCSPTTLEAIKKMLVNVVNNNTGTGYPAKSDIIKIAGKTGGLKNTALFCGYFPADSPKYSCIVIIDNPKNGNISGGVMAGTVLKEIAENISQ